MSDSRSPIQPSDLPPEELRDLARSARESADRPGNGLMPADRQLLRRNAFNLERIADHKERRYALQNRHPQHPTKQ